MPESITVTIPIGASAAGGVSAADDYYTCHGQAGEWKLGAAYFVPMLAVTADASNYVSFQIENGFEGTSTTVSSAMTTATVAMAIGTVREFTLTENTSREFGPTDVIFVDHDEAGTFSANVEGTIVCRFDKIRA